MGVRRFYAGGTPILSQVTFPPKVMFPGPQIFFLIKIGFDGSADLNVTELPLLKNK